MFEGCLGRGATRFVDVNLQPDESCYGVTGLAGKGNSAQPCGRARYCENCEKVIQQLDQGYHFIVLVNGTTNIITRALGLWRRGSDGAEWTRPENWDRRHQCGISCPHNPSQGS